MSMNQNVNLGPVEATPAPILEVLRKYENRLANNLAQRTLKFGHLQIEILGFRGQLMKIVGKDHPALARFPPLVVGSLTPEQVLGEGGQQRLAMMRNIIDGLELALQTRPIGDRIFFGHGRSAVWRELKDFVQDRLHLEYDEFNSDPIAGMATSERLSEMLERAAIAFLIMTAEDELADGTPQARPNVIHEIGLFQGRLGLRRAIVLVEVGCSEFSNIVGLTQIRFPKGQISACFEEVRKVLEREGIISLTR
jgi:hypothetical protein